MNQGTRRRAACLQARTGPQKNTWCACVQAALLAVLLAGCAGVHDDAPVVRQLRPGEYRAATRSARASPPEPAHCVFTPSHGLASGETIPPSYACIRLNPRQYAAGRCAEVAGYERDDGIFMPGHTRCLVDPLTPGLSDQAPVAGSGTPASIHGSALPPPAHAATPADGLAPRSAPSSPDPAASAPTASTSLPSTVSGGTLPAATTVPAGAGAARSSPEAAHSVVRRRGNELILPSGAPTGIDQGNGTFVSPIQAPGDVSNRAY